MKPLLITTVTHGDEGFSVPVVKKLAKKYNFDWQMNNLKAFKLGKRYFQKDLNRSGPGDPRSEIYEERLAYKIINKSKKYRQVIDIHGSISNCGVFIILSEPSTQNIELAKKLDIENVVLWPSLRAMDAPLTQFIPNSLEIECGPMTDVKIIQGLKKVLIRFLKGKMPAVTQKYFIVTGRIEKNLKYKWQDFQPATYNGIGFYPLLVDQYPGIKCYTLQQVYNPLSKSI